MVGLVRECVGFDENRLLLPRNRILPFIVRAPLRRGSANIVGYEAIVDVIHIAVAISHIFKSHRLTVYRHVHVRSSYKQWRAH